MTLTDVQKQALEQAKQKITEARQAYEGFQAVTPNADEVLASQTDIGQRMLDLASDILNKIG